MRKGTGIAVVLLAASLMTPIAASAVSTSYSPISSVTQDGSRVEARGQLHTSVPRHDVQLRISYRSQTNHEAHAIAQTHTIPPGTTQPDVDSHVRSENISTVTQGWQTKYVSASLNSSNRYAYGQYRVKLVLPLWPDPPGNWVRTNSVEF